MMPYRMRLGFGARAMQLTVALVPKYRARVEGNLRHVFPEMPESRRRQVRRGMADSFGRTFIEITCNRDFHSRGRWIAPQSVAAEALLAAARAGRGVVIVTGHFGQWEAIRAWVVSRGFVCAGVYRPVGNPRLNALYADNLGIAGPLFAKDRSGVRGMVRHLSRGGVLGMLTDQYEKRAAPLDFVGQSAPTALVPAELALKFGAPMFPAIGRRLPDGVGVAIEIDPEIPRGTAREMMQEANDALAARVRTTPEQYYWLHRRWTKALPA